MVNPLIAALFNLREHRSSSRSVFVLVDNQLPLDTAEIVRCSSPWHSWMTITGILTVDRQSVATALLTGDAKAADIILCISNDGAVQTVARAHCYNTKQIYVDTTLPPQNSRELGLLQEVLHHDFELGGFNEWANTDAQSSSSVLRLLSVTQSHRSFPAYAGPHLAQLWQENCGRTLQALDVGCGALSRLRWGALRGLLNITGVDPLLDMYAIVRERHGYASLPEIRCAREICAGAEALSTAIVPGSFDVAYSANALDHTEDPAGIVAALARALRPGGLLFIDVYTREASRENWWQLHQFDMYINDRDEFVAETKDGTVRQLVPPGCGLVMREIASRDKTTAVVLERAADQPLRKTA
ncbi:MAG TPA: class I SAM-dependent methyltransferase [Vicinamibacterales bacterium]|nr:class I SAM-dependent methyltransferase [Vicinamibacterales bacterium]